MSEIAHGLAMLPVVVAGPGRPLMNANNAEQDTENPC